jgi:hypothetical protein
MGCGLSAMLVVALNASVLAQPSSTNSDVSDPSPRRLIDFTDPTYGGRIRQLFNPAGDEHDLYHYRSVFNADNSRLLGIEAPKGTTDYRVTLYGGDGRFLKPLFKQAKYDGTLGWDRREARYFYTRKNGTVSRYDVEASEATALRTFESPTIDTNAACTVGRLGYSGTIDQCILYLEPSSPAAAESRR